jgi:hypothetical protein
VIISKENYVDPQTNEDEMKSVGEKIWKTAMQKEIASLVEKPCLGSCEITKTKKSNQMYMVI